MRIILLRSCNHLKLCIILCMLCVLIFFYIYQTIQSFPNKFKSRTTKFRKCFYYDNEDKAVSSFFFGVCFDR